MVSNFGLNTEEFYILKIEWVFLSLKLGVGGQRPRPRAAVHGVQFADAQRCGGWHRDQDGVAGGPRLIQRITEVVVAVNIPIGSDLRDIPVLKPSIHRNK